MIDSTMVILALVGFILLTLFLAWLYIFLPIGMARKRGRSVIATLLLFWFLSPICGIILLILIGDAPKKEPAHE